MVELSAREVGTSAAASPHPNMAFLEEMLKNEVGDTEENENRGQQRKKKGEEGKDQ